MEAELVVEASDGVLVRGSGRVGRRAEAPERSAQDLGPTSRFCCDDLYGCRRDTLPASSRFLC